MKVKWKLGWKLPWCWLQMGYHDYILGHDLFASDNGKWEAYVFCNCATVWRTTEVRNQNDKEFPQWPM